MQTQIGAPLSDTAEGQEANDILRKCVHCGFCAATCPTYQLLGDELDSPRGRIYLIKSTLEGSAPTRQTQLHLDRCLTCRSCETTCPSGVRYGRLLDIGRQHVERLVPRTVFQRLTRRVLLGLIPWRSRFSALIGFGRAFRQLTFGSMRRAVSPARTAGSWPAARHERRMLILQGCVQPSLAPSINAAAARVLDKAGISLICVEDGCCGAMAHHLSADEQARQQMRRNIDAWWPEIERGAEAIVATSSGCGAMIREYAYVLRDEPEYALRAARVSELFRDISQVVAQELENLELKAVATRDPGALSLPRLAFHAPCTLQHGLRLRGVERLLQAAGFTLVPVVNAHLCCGSAGTYSILQPRLARQLRANKLAALQAQAPDVIATSNIGCLMHLGSATDRPVRHWIELLDWRLAADSASQLPLA